MPTVTIDGRSVEVEAGTNLIEAGLRTGVRIPHYCYHPRLSVVGQCRMCLVKVEGMPKLQTGCTTQVMRDGMVVHVDDPEVQEAQEGIMEFFLINHPLDCPICDQAGECGLQDYSFAHGQAFSRFRFEEKRTYPGRERIPLGPNVLLNMNRCIQCTRCIRFTEEISETGELGFFQRGARTEIGVFPGRPLDNPLATNVVDLCPVGALTSTRFRFAERVWYLDKKPSLCTGCEVGCNISLEHRRGSIRRYKPRFNPEVNDYWMCDHGRGTFERYLEGERLLYPRVRDEGATPRHAPWAAALDRVYRRIAQAEPGGVAFLASGHLSTEEAFLLRALADGVGSPHRGCWVEEGEERRIPNTHGGATGCRAAPNARGAELAGMRTGKGGVDPAEALRRGEEREWEVLVVADSELGAAAHAAEKVALLRRTAFLVVLGWQDNPLMQAADVALPAATHAERTGTFVNVQDRLQRFDAAFPAPGEARPASAFLVELLARFEARWEGAGTDAVFEGLAAAEPAFRGLAFHHIPPTGQRLETAGKGE